MRPVLLIAFAALLPGAEPRPVGLTIVTEFRGPHSERSVAEMKRETESILKESGFSFDWRNREDIDGAAFPDLVVVRFNGKCVLEPVGFLYDERGPLAFTYASDGHLLPFSEVACDHITSSIRSAMWGGDYAKPDEMLGRALGRVLAHELVHILSGSAGHGRGGVAKAALSAAQLISSRLTLDRDDLARVHRHGESAR